MSSCHVVTSLWLLPVTTHRLGSVFVVLVLCSAWQVSAADWESSSVKRVAPGGGRRMAGLLPLTA